MKRKIIAGVAIATITLSSFGGVYMYNKQAEAKEIAKVEAKEANYLKEATAAVEKFENNLNLNNLNNAKQKVSLVKGNKAHNSLMNNVNELAQKFNFLEDISKSIDKKGILKDAASQKVVVQLEKSLKKINDRKFVESQKKQIESIKHQLGQENKTKKFLQVARKSVAEDNDVTKSPSDNLQKRSSEFENVSQRSNNNNYSGSSDGNNQRKSNNTSGYKGNNSDNTGTISKPSVKSSAKPKIHGGTSTTGERTGGGKIKNSDSTYETGVADGNDLSGVPWDSFSK